MLNLEVVEKILYETFTLDVEHQGATYEDLEIFVHNVELGRLSEYKTITIMATGCINDDIEIDFVYDEIMNDEEYQALLGKELGDLE